MTRPYAPPRPAPRPGATRRRPSWLATLWPFLRALLPGLLVATAGIAARLAGA